MRRKYRALRSATIVAVALAPSTAQAHSPIPGLGAFYSHFLHPVLVLPHVLLLVACALMLGQQGRPVARAGVIVLATSFCVGMIVANSVSIDQVPERYLLGAAALVGATVSLGHRLPIMLAKSAALVAGAALGLDSGPETTSGGSVAIGFAGLAAGATYFSLLIAGLTVEQSRPWLRIGVRIVGSWIVAATMLVLALSFAPPSTRRISTGEIVVTMAPLC